MHSTACGVGASTANSTTASIHSTDGLKMMHSNDDAMNKIPLKSASGLDDEEKNGGEFMQDTEAAEEARREKRRADLLKWMKKLTIVLICFIGFALIAYVIFSLCFTDENNNHNNAINGNGNGNGNNSTTSFNENPHDGNKLLLAASIAATRDKQEPAGAEHGDEQQQVEQTRETDATSPPTPPTPTTADEMAAASDGIVAVGYDDDAETPTATEPPPSPTQESPLPAAATTTVKATRKPTPPPHFKDILVSDTKKFESKLGVYEAAAVCSDREVCSQIGSHILEVEGSAVDAAIATLLCNGITTMHSMGIGGGMLMNVYIKDSQHAYTIDAREVAPFSAHQDMFNHNENISRHGPLSIAVPGELMGYHQAHERFGKLPWKQLVEPSIKLCREGFYMTPHQHAAASYKKAHFKNSTLLTNVFLNPASGEVHPVGTLLKPQPELCDTYTLLAQNGPLDFYNGTLANLVIEDLKDLGSPITLYDLETYIADLVSSITMQLGDDILYVLPPISSGTVVANILSVLEGYNFTAADLVGEENEANTIHRFVEAMKFGFAKRWELGDLRFNDVRELVSKMTNPAHSVDIRAQINDSSVLDDISEYGAQFRGVDDEGTSQIVVTAPNGDTVSVTSTINEYFGSSQAGKRTGIIFNNAMNDFSIPDKANFYGLPSAPSNYIDVRKRPMSSMSPMILTDQKGNVRLAIGAAGGAKIISAIVEVAARILWFGQDIKEAIDAPRYHHQLEPNVLEYQKEGFSVKVLKLLRDKGHLIKPYKDVGSVACGIVRNGSAIYANADYRKRGGIAGF